MLSTVDMIDVKRAVAALRAGQLVGLPTETVYGLAADAENARAVRRIFEAKGRPADHPLIVHVASVAAMERFVRDVPSSARVLAERFWPGPLTMILRRSRRVPDEVTGGLDTVGIRVPDHPVALALLGELGGGVAAPSANRFGRISPTRAEHVREELGDKVAVVLDGGPCRVGVESTIVSLAGEKPLLLRPGAILPSQLEEVLGVAVQTPTPLTHAQEEVPRAPGTLASHYAPRTPLELLDERSLIERVSMLQRSNLRMAVLARFNAPPALSEKVLWTRAPDEPERFAHDLYAALRELDAKGADRILVERVPENGAWLPVADRLQRAAHPTEHNGDET